jgi:hypothetical protein
MQRSSRLRSRIFWRRAGGVRTFYDQRANDEVYRFRQRRVVNRLDNEEMRQQLTPESHRIRLV